jgi:hypothetical protein
MSAEMASSWRQCSRSRRVKRTSRLCMSALEADRRSTVPNAAFCSAVTPCRHFENIDVGSAIAKPDFFQPRLTELYGPFYLVRTML